VYPEGSGSYNIPFLALGEYKIEAEAPVTSRGCAGNTDQRGRD